MKRRVLFSSVLWLSASGAALCQGTPGTFTPTESMSIQRQLATATLISGCNCPADGKVLIVGGVIDGATATTNTAQLYDPTTGQFSPTGNMNVARGGHAAALLPGGKVLIVGAIDSPGPVDAEVYDPLSGLFSCVAGTDPVTGYCNPTLAHNGVSLLATTLQSGKVLVTGLQTPTSAGQTSNAAVIYDPSQSTFTCVGGLSATPGICNPSMGSLHTRGTANLLGNGTVLVAGGADSVTYTRAAEIYDPSVPPNGAFIATANLLATRGFHTATLLKTGEVLITGGTTDSGNFNLSNVNTAEVYANGAFSAVGNMSHVRVNHTATLLSDGTVLIAGGCCEVSNLQMPYAEIYNPEAKTFAPTGDMNEARATHTATLLPTGQVLVAGGFFSGTAELYAPIPPDTITSISPNSGTQGQTITSFTVGGTNFDANATLSFSGAGITVNSYTSRTTTQIIASVTISSTAATGPRDIIVVNSAGQQATLAAAFTVLGLPGTHTLIVASTNPTSGATIMASPSDNDGLGVGTTQFALTYNQGTVVTLTADSIASGNNFSNWTGCDSAQSPTCTVTMDAVHGDRTVTANYVTPSGGQPDIGVSPVPLDFGTVAVNASPTKGLFVQNTGTATLSVTNITSSNDAFKVFPFSFALEPGHGFTVSVTFSPAMPGPTSGVLTITSNVSTSPTLVNMTGRASISLMVILARASDAPQPESSHTAEYFRNDLFPKLRRYHSDNSYGLVNLQLSEIRDNGGSWFQLGSMSKYTGHETAFVQDAVAAAGIASDTDVVIVVHTGPASQTADIPFLDCGQYERFLCTETSIFANGTAPAWVLVSEDNLVGGWAHEIGHDLGLFSPSRQMIPHPAPSGVQRWDLMATGGWGCGPQPCPSGTAQSIPVFMSSLTRHFLGFLAYDSKTETEATGSQFWVNALETTQLHDKVSKIDLDDGHCYILEVRSADPKFSLWDTSVPATGLVLYHVDPKGVPTCGGLTLGPNSNDSQENINVADRLDPPSASATTSFDDWSHSLRFTAHQIDTTNGQYRIKVSVDGLSNPFSMTMLGIVLTGGMAYQRVASCCNDMPTAILPTIPDLDLHAFTEDGKHVGLNYATGQFENQITNVDASGDQFNGHEWIVPPASIAGIHFVVSDLKALQFLMEFPQFQATLGSTDVFGMSAVIAAPGGPPSTVGKSAGTIPTGGFLEVPLIRTQNPDGTITIKLGNAIMTIDSLLAELNSYFVVGAVKTADAYRGLKDKLTAASYSIAAGNKGTAINQLKAFQNQLSADSLVTNQFAFQRLMGDSQTLITQMSVK